MSRPGDVGAGGAPRFGDDDERPHDPGDQPEYSESMYFNAVDASTGYAVLVRMGNRVNEGHSEVTVLAFLPDGGALFHYARVPITGVAGFDAGGLRFDVEEPGRQVRVHFDGTAHRLVNGTDLADPGTALRDSPQLPLTLRLDYGSLAPLFGLGAGEAGTAGMGGGEDVVAASHYEVPCRVSGSLEFGGELVAFNGLGIRDHSWGPRRWQGPRYWRWLSGMFDERTAFVAWAIRVGEQRAPGSGMLMTDGRVSSLVAVDVGTEYGAAPYYPKAMRLTLTAEAGQIVTATGEVLGIVPLRNRRDGVTARLAEVVVRFESNGRTGYGIAEYHDLILDGVPAGMAEA